MCKTFFLSILFMLSFSSFPSEGYPDCSQGGSSTIDRTICMNIKYVAADKSLNKVYKSIMNSGDIDSNTKKRIKKMQILWIEYKGLSCDIFANTQGAGSTREFIRLNCLTDVTNRQLELLISLN